MRSLRPIAAAFVVFGVFWGGWAVAAADVERDLDLSHGRFGLLLSLSLAAAAVANAVGGALAERHGTRRTLAVALVLWGVGLAGGAAASSLLAFGAALVVVIAAGGVIDVTMNVAATSGLAGEPARLVRFHAFFNVGAAIGAGGVGLLTAAGISWRWALLADALLGAVLAAVIVRRHDLPAGDAGTRAPLGGALALLRREHLGLLALAFAVGSMVEGGVELWGVLLLRTTLPAGLAIGATSAGLGYLVAAAARVVFGPAAGRHGAARGVTIGAAAAVVGILMLGLAGPALLAGAGLVVAAGGISMCWPLLLSLVAAGRERPGPAIGAVTSVGYLGFVVGPTIVGWLAATLGLRSGLLLLAVAAAYVAIAPRARALRTA
ncbi:MAG: MFS transporter [Actinomycetota bacterium]|nr:MFS transporter [Actinomycetota bacterium]